MNYVNLTNLSVDKLIYIYYNIIFKKYNYSLNINLIMTTILNF
jgi:hypothetical protein